MTNHPKSALRFKVLDLSAARTIPFTHCFFAGFITSPTIDDITKILGEPTLKVLSPTSDAFAKSSLEWWIQFDDGTLASIYEYIPTDKYSSVLPESKLRDIPSFWHVCTNGISLAKKAHALQLVQELFPKCKVVDWETACLRCFGSGTHSKQICEACNGSGRRKKHI